MIEDTIVAVLVNIGVAPYPLVAPHDAVTPCVVYQQISTFPIRSHEGYVADRARWQLSCYAHERNEVLDLAAQVRAAFDLNRIDFELSTLESEIETVDDTGLFRKILDFNVWR
jgi:hypothetical protein